MNKPMTDYIEHKYAHEISDRAKVDLLLEQVNKLQKHIANMQKQLHENQSHINQLGQDVCALGAGLCMHMDQEPSVKVRYKDSVKLRYKGVKGLDPEA